MKLPKELQKKIKDKPRRKLSKKTLKRESKKDILKVIKQDDIYKLNLNMNAEEHKEFIKDLKGSKPIVESKINHLISKLRKIVKQNNPLELLQSICIHNILCDPENYRESTHLGLEAYVEYALSLILSNECEVFTLDTSMEVLNDFNYTIIELFNLVKSYYIIDSIGNKNDSIVRSIRLMSILKFMVNRGDSYSHHHKEMLLELFNPHNDFLNQNFGFTIEKLINVAEEIQKQINENILPYKEYPRCAGEIHQIYKNFLRSKGLDENIAFYWEGRDEFNSLPEVQVKLKELKEIRSKMKNIFLIESNTRIPKNILEFFSSTFGENCEFYSYEETPCWPLNNSIIYTKPILKKDNEYYGFGFTVFFRNLKNILENLILNEDEHYFKRSYDKSRAKYLEKKTLEYFKKIFPRTEIYYNLYYPIPKKINERTECDGLILFDTNIFVIESKAGSYKIPARRGALKSIKKLLKDTIDEAYSQAIRTKNYILNTQNARFEYENGEEALIINHHKYENFYLLNITLENLGSLATQLHEIRNFNLIQGKDWPWSIFINDIRIISEIVEGPSIFLLFLKRRIQANDSSKIFTIDELDYFMYFLKKGLSFKEQIWDDITKGIIVGFTYDLDNYYHYQLGLRSEAEKPTLQIPGEFKDIVNEIENLEKEGFSFVTATLLGLNLDLQKLIISDIATLKTLFDEDDEDKSFIVNSEDPKSLILFIIRMNNSKMSQNNYIDDFKQKLIQNDFNIGIIIKITYLINNQKLWDFEIVKF